MFLLPYFEQQLVEYVTSDDKSAFDTPFDISKIPVVTREQADAEDRTKKLTATTPSLKPPKAGPTKTAPSAAEAAASATAAAQKYAQELMQIPEMKEFGAVLKSSPLVELTEAETEYAVGVIKHIFKEHIVLQYEIKNTIPGQILENVSVVATPSEEEELEEVFIVQAEKLETDVPGKVYVAFRKVSGEGSLPVSTFSNVLKFTTKEIDPTTNEPEETGYDDEYEVADFDLTGSDYVIPAFASNFAHVWEQVGAQGEEAEETLQLSNVKSIAGKFLSLNHRLTSHISEQVLTAYVQRRRNSSPRRCRCSRSRGRTCRSTRRRTRSSSWARRSMAGGWWPTCAWRTRPRRASRPRSRCAARRRAWRRWWWLPSRKKGHESIKRVEVVVLAATAVVWLGLGDDAWRYLIPYVVWSIKFKSIPCQGG